jgi:hypothetical protein
LCIFPLYNISVGESENRWGRPFKASGRLKTKPLLVRLEATEKEAFRNAAELAGVPLSTWVRERLRLVAVKELQDAARPVPFLKHVTLEGPVMSTNPTEGMVLPDQFFVRTLTPNDVEKLFGNTPGTFETDLGETARDGYPTFWGWPDNYEEVIRRKPEGRLEWKARASLYSSEKPRGVPVTAMLWYREAREGHAAEHRLGLQPIGRVRTAVPSSFNTESLMVVERAPGNTNEVFVIRFITAGEPGYGDFAKYLTEDRPQHRYGYGR